MKKDSEFNESQQFRHPVLLGGLGLGALYYFGGLWDALLKGGAIDGPMLIGPITMGLLLALFVFANLKTSINSKGIYVQFFPFHTRYVLYPWKDITQAKLVVYSPLKDFGGWGIRLGWKGTKAFNVKGKEGIYLELKNGKKRLIGTQKPDEAEVEIAKYLVVLPTKED